MSRTLTSAASLGRRHINSITSRSSGPSSATTLPVLLTLCGVKGSFMRGSIRNNGSSAKRIHLPPFKRRALFRSRRDRELVEITDAVGLRPQSDFAGDRFSERVIEQMLAVQPSFELE